MVRDVSDGGAGSSSSGGGGGGGVLDWFQALAAADSDAGPQEQSALFYVIAAAYGVIAVVAVVQLARIQLRVPEYGWTTQKLFHLLNFCVAVLRCGVFTFRLSVSDLKPKVLGIVLLDSPGLLFFTTYTLLVLFWAEIYHQARSLSTGALRPLFGIINAVVYLLQLALWVYMGLVEGYDGTRFRLAQKTAACFLAAVSVLAAAGFVSYGGRLFVMLRRFPIESRGRRKKLREVGLVTAVCTTCFTARAVFIAYSSFKKAASLDVLDHPLLNTAYYLVVEVVPSALVLVILRKLPPKRPQAAGYHAIS